MHFDPKKKVRHVSGEHIVISQQGGATDLTSVMALNDSALLIYEKLRNKEFTVSDMAHVLTEQYDVDFAVAQRDAAELAEAMLREKLLLP